MNSIQEQIVEWHRATFPNASTDAVQDKLSEEAQELVDVLKDLPLDTRDISLEIADVIIVSCALIDRWGLGIDQIVLDKLAVNRERAWGKETANGDRPRQR